MTSLHFCRFYRAAKPQSSWRQTTSVCKAANANFKFTLRFPENAALCKHCAATQRAKHVFLSGNGRLLSRKLRSCTTPCQDNRLSQFSTIRSNNEVNMVWIAFNYSSLRNCGGNNNLWMKSVNYSQCKFCVLRPWTNC